jgi:hypothetical protein
LKAIREQIGCTQVQMATRLGITPGAYRKYETERWCQVNYLSYPRERTTTNFFYLPYLWQ